MNLNKIKEELTNKGMAKEGLAAWGNKGNGSLFGAMSAFSPMFAVSMTDTGILITPFNNKTIFTDNTNLFKKEDISSVKMKGFWIFKHLEIVTNDGNKHRFDILQGANDVKKMISILGF